MTVITTMLVPVSMHAKKYRGIGRFTSPVTRSPILILNLSISLRSDTSSPETMDLRYVNYEKAAKL